MQKCTYCGASLSENTRFCGKCGRVQDALASDAAATRSNTPQSPSWQPEDGIIAASWPPSSNDSTQDSAPTWSSTMQAPETPALAAENEGEERSDIAPWSPLYGAVLTGETLLGSGSAYAAGAPAVQGTPQVGSVPSVTGSSTLSASAPVGHPGLGAGNAASVNPFTQGITNAAPVSHPVQGPTNAPISHPIQRPEPIHHRPEPPGTHRHHPPHGPHQHHPERPEHHEQHERPEHHSHPAQHESHRVTRVSKVAHGSTMKTIMIVVIAAVVVAAGGIGVAIHFLAHPQQFISVSSNYRVGNTLAGANGTILHISGQNFASNSPITFLLDDHVAPGNGGTRSDSNGNFSTNVAITSAWSIGTHTLTARDASNNSTQKSVSVTIVQQGQANTPGPDGAPPDDASFKIIANIQRQGTSGNPYSTQETVIVTGRPDPLGGTACQTEDTGQPISVTGVTASSSIPYQETVTLSCVGSYKGGKFTLTETVRSDITVYSLPDGTTSTCMLNSPQPDEQLSGSYTGNNTFSGTISYLYIPASDYSCTGEGSSYSFYGPSSQYNWAGQITDLHS